MRLGVLEDLNDRRGMRVGTRVPRKTEVNKNGMARMQTIEKNDEGLRMLFVVFLQKKILRNKWLVGCRRALRIYYYYNNNI